MLKRKFHIIIFLIGIFISPFLFSSCMAMMGMGGGMGMGGHGNHSMASDHDMQNNNSADTTIIRKGIIDVESIDVNKDGFVFQDQMNWNVISDNPGKCPICGMDLKKTTVKEAIKNLKDNNFEVKNYQGESK